MRKTLKKVGKLSDIAESVEETVRLRMIGAFLWEGAIDHRPDMTIEEIASAAASQYSCVGAYLWLPRWEMRS